MPKKIFITRRIPDLLIKMLKDKGYEVDINDSDTVPSQKRIISWLKKKSYDGVVTMANDKVDKAVLTSVPSAKIFANYAIGFDNIDLSLAKSLGITVTNTPGTFAFTIAEHAMAMILTMSTRIVEANDFMRKGKYKGWVPMAFIGTDLRGKTIGLVGAGHIGTEVARSARNGFGMNILYTDVVRNDVLEKDLGAEYVDSIDKLLPRADFVSLHTPLLPSTLHLIDEKRLHAMKSTAFLINTSRGPVIDEVALVAALKAKVIAGAALDVYEFEPKLVRGLTKLHNVVLTPHNASASKFARDEMARIAAQGMIEFFEGRVPNNAVSLG